MAYNLASLRQIVKDRLVDQNFSNLLINQFINDEQREILNYYDLPFNRASFVHTLNIGESQLFLPPNHQKTKTLRVTGPEGYEMDLTRYYLPYGKFREVFREPTVYGDSQPLWWTIYNDAIIFSWNTNMEMTLQQDYLKAAVTLDDDADTPEIPEEFQEVLVLGALVRCYETNDDNDIAQYQQGKKNLLLQALLKRYSPQQSGKVERIRNSARGI
jgi:hypothetical protein